MKYYGFVANGLPEPEACPSPWPWFLLGILTGVLGKAVLDKARKQK
jgi:hypothetical protein